MDERLNYLGQSGEDTEKLIDAIFGKCEAIADCNGRVIAVGDRIFLPAYYKKTKRQSRANIVVSVHPEAGRKYIVLAKILRNGKASKDVKTFVYWHVRNLDRLFIV